MEKFLKDLAGKSIHIVGVTGAEGSSILRLLIKNNVSNITAHDFLSEGSLEKSFRTWHKGIPISQKREQFQIFLKDLSKVKFYSSNEYLKGINSADIIFVPQSWRLYKKQNQALWVAKKKNIPFYSLTRLYLDFAPAKIIAVTGTVGKGSVASLIFQLFKSIGSKCYFAGNETWMMQLADKLEEMSSQDILVLEVSHRQLQDGWSRAPYLIIITNLYPNHLDEVGWEEYKSLKLSFIKSQDTKDISILNYDIPELRVSANKLKSKVLFFSPVSKNMNTKNAQKYYKELLDNKNAHFSANLLAAFTVFDAIGVNLDTVYQNLSEITPLRARLEYLEEIKGVKFYDDIKSTTPWATREALRKLSPGVILICGGRTKGINYQNFIKEIKEHAKYLIILESELSKSITRYLPRNLYQTVKNLGEAIRLAKQKSCLGDKILISPAAGFFYSDFIKGKYSLRRLISSYFSSSKGAS